jgi:hypothetical protein
MSRVFAGLLLGLIVLGGSSSVTRSARGAAPPVIYVLAIGNNALPVDGRGVTNETPLSYADDDAAAIFHFFHGFSARGSLLTLMDPDTQRLFPDVVGSARPPSLVELRAEVARLRASIDDDRKRGQRSAVLVFYSGHGMRPSGAAPYLALLDGGLTRQILYDEILSGLGAEYVHLFIDACYAESIVRPRDAEAKIVDLTDTDIASYAASSTLSRFPNVGAVIASSRTSQTHEWDVYRHGVFTYQLLSGLRGGADVNVDGRVEYSELYAFLVAANRDVTDARARLSIVARAPAENGRIPVVELGRLRAAARITDIPSTAGLVYFEDHRGNRLVDLRVEGDAKLALTLPAGSRLFVYSHAGEGETLLRANRSVSFASLSLRRPSLRQRGALDAALRRGLFATAFGPSYYRGFIDGQPAFVSVAIPENEVPVQSPGQSRTIPWSKDEGRATERGRKNDKDTRSLWILASAGATRGVAEELGPMMAMQFGMRSAIPTGFAVNLEGAWGQAKTFDEWRALATAGYRWGLDSYQFRAFAYAGADLGGGVIGQAVDGKSNAWTGAGALVPTIGTGYRLGAHSALNLELDVTALLYRRDGEFAVSALPAAFLGFVVEP